MADVKARGGVRIKNDDAINLKVGQAAMWWFAIERHFLYHIANEQKHVINDSVCQWGIGFWFEGQPINETDTCISGNEGWRYNWCVSSLSAKKGMYYFTPELTSYRPSTFSIKKTTQFVSTTSWLLQYSFSILSVSPCHSFVVHKVTGVSAQTSCILKRLNGQGYVLIDTRGRWDGKDYWICENTLFLLLHAWHAHSTLNFIFHKLSWSGCLTKEKQHKKILACFAHV